VTASGAARGAGSEGAAGSEDYSVFTPERVSLRYDVAGIGSRGAAALIDTTIQAVIGFAVLILNVFVSAMGFRFGGMWDSPWVAVAILILGALAGFFLLWGYYVLFEILWSGQTPGKRALGLRVIRENGYPIRPGDAVVRNLIRIVDGPPFGAVIGSLVMLCNDRAKRIGDFAAGTIVVRERPAELPRPLPSVDQSLLLPPHLAGAFKSTDILLARDFLRRAPTLLPGRRDALRTQIAATLRARLAAIGQAPPDLTGEQLLAAVAALRA
jgi:uncharacterized RDD family membrane protein YckC